MLLYFWRQVNLIFVTMNIKKNIFNGIAIKAVFAFCLLSCHEDEVNRPPSSFKVLILEVGSNFAVISWEPVSDPDGDALYRTVSLEGTTVAADVTEDKPVRVENLTSSKAYTGTVSITDKKNNPIVVPFQFTTGTNQKPPSFNVVIKETGQNFAVIAWDAVTDPEGDPLYRSISLEGTTVVTDLTEDKPFKLDNLKSSKSYSGTVSITDKKSDPVVVPFTFTTKKYITTFNKLISQYNDQYLQGFSICKTADGGYAVGANFSDGNAYGLFVMKFDSLGNEEWHTPIEAHHEISFDGTISQTKDNGYIVVDQASITKLNSSGVLQWQQIPPVWYQYYNSVIETDDLGYLVVGMIGGLTPARGTIIKFSSNGSQEWEKFFDGEAAITMSSCSQIVKTSGNDYMIAGTHQRPSIDFELAIARIDALGNIYWVKNYAHSWQTFYMGVEIRPANNGFIIGSTSLASDNSQRARMVRISESGDIIWDQSFQWGGYETTCKGIRSTDDGNFLFVGGYTNSQHYETAIIVKLNSNGDLLWKKDYKPTYQDFVWEFRGVEQTVDSGFILMGIKAWIWSGDGKDKGLWLLKTDKNGDY